MPPVLAAATALLDRGHGVAILSQPSVRERAIAAGCDFLRFSEAGDYRRDVALEEQLDLAIPMLVSASTGKDLVGAAETIAADAVVVDPNLSGALAAAESLDLPTAVLLHSLFRTFVDVWFGELWPVLADPINDTRRTFGVAAAGGWAEMLAAHDLIISPIPDVFDAPVDSAPKVLRHVGFLVPSPSPDEALELPPGSEPLVAVSFSTTFQRQERLIAETLAALADENLRVIATTSGYAPSAPLPANAVSVEFVPHATLFHHAQLVITHAGLGTTAASLRAGVPLLCLPLGRDQPLNAARVAALGAGMTIASDSDRHALRHAAREVMSNPSYRTAAATISDASRAAGEGEAVAKALETILA